jgi:hypothetical protein
MTDTQAAWAAFMDAKRAAHIAMAFAQRADARAELIYPACQPEDARRQHRFGMRSAIFYIRLAAGKQPARPAKWEE